MLAYLCMPSKIESACKVLHSAYLKRFNPTKLSRCTVTMHELHVLNQEEQCYYCCGVATVLTCVFVMLREPRLLIDPHHSSAAVKKDVALVVGHELAHQWFGNLVSTL